MKKRILLLTFLLLGGCKPTSETDNTEKVHTTKKVEVTIKKAESATTTPAESDEIRYPKTQIALWYQQLAEVNAMYDQAFKADNTTLFSAAKTKLSTLRTALDQVEGINTPAHPAYACYMAGTYIETRNIAWTTLHSKTATKADLLIDQENLIEAVQQLEKCKTAAER